MCVGGGGGVCVDVSAYLVYACLFNIVSNKRICK